MLMPSDYGLEEKLILQFAHARFLEVTVSEIRSLLHRDIDYERFLSLAISHGIGSLTYIHAAEHFGSIIPPSILDELKMHFIVNVRNNMLMAAELRELLQLLQANNIPAVPYKGLALAHFIYPDPDMRESSDIDVFVKQQNLTKLRELLVVSGYELIKPPPHVKPQRFERWFYHYVFRRDRSNRIVEIHWRFVRDMAILIPDEQWPWNRLQKFTFNNISTEIFSPEDILLLLCVHGGKHLWPHLSNVVDVAELLGQFELDWEYLLMESRKRYARRFMLVGLLLAHDLLGVRLPSRILEIAQTDRTALALAREMGSQFFSCDMQGNRFSPIESIWKSFAIRDTLAIRLRYGSYFLLFDPRLTNAQANRLSPPMLAFNRGLRVVRLILYYGLGLVQRFFSHNRKR